MPSPNKVYLLMHRTWGDFDTEIKEVVLASHNKATLELEAADRNAKRTSRQIDDEEEFFVESKPVDMI